MPCPPSYEEQQAMSGESSLRLATEKAHELREVQALIAELLAAGSTDEAAVVTHGAADPTVNVGQMPDFWNDPTQVKPLFEWVDAAYKELQRLKVALCEASCQLVRLWDVIPEARRRPDWKDRYRKAEASHRQHREQDRGQVLRNLAARKRGAAKGSVSELTLSRVERDVRALDIEVLLRDRDALPDM